MNVALRSIGLVVFSGLDLSHGSRRPGPCRQTPISRIPKGGTSMNRKRALSVVRGYLAPAFTAFAVAPALSIPASAKQPYNVRADYVEGCTCMGVCPCEQTGVMDGCQGLGAIALKQAKYMGKDISGAKIAYATVPGKWVRLYVQPKTPAQSAAVRAFARANYAMFGKVEVLRDARVQMNGKNGKYSVKVDGGKVASFNTVPVLGGDGRTPIEHKNVKDPMIHTMMQGKTVAGTYHDGDRSFTLKGSNSFFNNHIVAKGTI